MLKRSFAAVALAVLTVAAAPARADPPLWRAHGAGGRELVMFGSVHLLDAGEMWMTPALAQALAGADRVWFEIPLDAQAKGEAQARAVALGRLPAGETLPALLSAAGRARLKTVAGELKLPDAAFDHMQPWLAEAVLSVSYFLKAGARSDLGVEEQVARAAPPAAARGALETVDDQLAALSGGSRADQLASLEQTLHDIHDEPQSFRRLVAEWRRGDVRALVREELAPLRRQSPSVYARLVLDRNRRWVGELEVLLRTGPPGRTVVVVGVGHLIGAQGVPAQLRHDGIAVEGP